MPMLFVILPVQDLPTSRTFYEALGFGVNEHSSDDIVVKLLARNSFAELVGDAGAAPAGAATVVHCLTVGERSDVDEFVAKGVAAGGSPGVPAPDDDTTYTGSVTDPDGHVWQAMWMDQLHVVN
jgi:predicted lactoylglutathione lyase